MRKIHTGLMLMALLLSSSVFANKQHMDSKACTAIVDACKKAGYERKETGDKRFWQDCMKPVMMGKTVKDVTMDSDTVKQCRSDKIAELKNKLKELESVSSDKSSK